MSTTKVFKYVYELSITLVLRKKILFSYEYAITVNELGLGIALRLVSLKTYLQIGLVLIFIQQCIAAYLGDIEIHI